MARPKKDLDVEAIRELAHIQCTMIEIAAVMRCSVDTLENRFSDVIKAGRESGKSSLRRAQWKKALEGHPSMLIWLGKCYLGQREEFAIASEEPEVRRLMMALDKKAEEKIKEKRASQAIEKPIKPEQAAD
jgi:hypothetical protein